MKSNKDKLSILESRFSNEEACREFLFYLRWPYGFRCPHCDNEAAWTVGEGLYQCTKCYYKVSITAGTIFEGTRKPMTLWFRAIWLVATSKNGANAVELQRILGLGSYETSWTWLHKMRRAMIPPDLNLLSGQVEVDETYINVKKCRKRSRDASIKALVFIAAKIEHRQIGRIRLRRVMNASASNLLEAIKQTIKPGSTILTDGLNRYSRLSSLKYEHEIIRDESALGDNLLPHCKRVAFLVKEWLKKKHQGNISHKHLDYYLDEYTFRFNRRKPLYRENRFIDLLRQAMATKPVPYDLLTRPTHKMIRR